MLQFKILIITTQKNECYIVSGSFLMRKNIKNRDFEDFPIFSDFKGGTLADLLQNEVFSIFTHFP